MRIVSMSSKERAAAIRNDARETAKTIKFGKSGNPMDFYSPMWADMKAHALAGGGLISLTAARIAENGRRTKIYTNIRDGFIKQWPELRGSFNGPLRQAPNKITATIEISGVDIKISGLFGVETSDTPPIYYYPYLYSDPKLKDSFAMTGIDILNTSIGKRTKVRIVVIDPSSIKSWAYDSAKNYTEYRAKFESELLLVIEEWRTKLEEYLSK